MGTPDQHLMHTYGRLSVTFTHGQGAWLYDTNNARYLDALSGIAVCGLGHSHPAVTEAIAKQAGTLLHTSNIYHIERQETLATMLAECSGMDTAFFCNSGAEANEAAIKLARKFGHQRGRQEPTIVVMSGAFHGRTLATLTATANPNAKVGFSPLPSGFIRVPYNDAAALESVLSTNDNIAAVLLEPVQGEGGLSTASFEYLKHVRTLCDEYDVLMMLDEVQTGNGRTGRFFCYQHTDILPDVVSTAKGLGNGVPIGACLAKSEAAHILQPGSHGSTYGGNALSCAAAIAVIETLHKDNVLDNVEHMSGYLREHFTTRLLDTQKIQAIRGRGLMIGLVMHQPCAELVQAALEEHLLINVTAGNVIRLLPPLNINKDEADMIINKVCALVDQHLNA